MHLLKEKLMSSVINDYKLFLNTQNANTVYYKGINIPNIKPRAFSCLFVMAKNPNIELDVKSIYEKAVEYNVDYGRVDPNEYNLPRLNTIRSEIRDAFLKGTENHRDLISEQEIKNIISSNKRGTTALLLPKEEVLVIGQLDEYPIL